MLNAQCSMRWRIKNSQCKINTFAYIFHNALKNYAFCILHSQLKKSPFYLSLGEKFVTLRTLFNLK